MKIYSIIVLMILLMSSIVYADVITNNPCTDSDKGYNIYLKGDTTTRFDDTQGGLSEFKTLEDTCLNSQRSLSGNGPYLLEHYCDNGIGYIDTVTCENGCQNGACIPDDVEDVACPQDAKLCSDGSYVSRTGQNCEFQACPSIACPAPSCVGAYPTGEVYKNGCAVYECPNDKISWKGHNWIPIYGNLGADSGYGNWFIQGTDLAQDQVNSLHPRIVSDDSYSNYEVTATLRFTKGTEAGVCTRMDQNGNGYCFSTGWGGSDSTMISKFNNNDQNPAHISSGNYFPISIGTDYNYKIRVEGNTIKGKIWQSDDLEPKKWTVEATDNKFKNGRIGFYTYSSQVQFKDVQVAVIEEPTCQSTTDANGCTITICSDGIETKSCPGSYVKLNQKFNLQEGHSVKVVDHNYMKIKLNYWMCTGTCPEELKCDTGCAINLEVSIPAECEATTSTGESLGGCAESGTNINLNQGGSQEVFGAKISYLAKQGQNAVLIVENPSINTGDVDIEIYPSESGINYGEKAVYKISLTDKHPVAACMLSCPEPGPCPPCKMQEYTYFIDVRNLPFYKEYPKQITLIAGETKTFELTVAPYAVEVPTEQTYTEQISEQIEIMARKVTSEETITQPSEITIPATAYRTYNFNIRAMQQNNPKNQDVAYATLSIRPEKPMPPEFPGEKTEIKLYKGWNLVSLPGKLVRFENIEINAKLVGYVYLKDQQKYVTIDEAQRILGDGIFEYLAKNAFWIYSYQELSLQAVIEREINYNEIQLKKGWNLVPITDDMIGGYLGEIKGDCTFEKIYIWNPQSQQWTKITEDYVFSNSESNRGFLLKAADDCRLSGASITLAPPSMPE